MALIKKPTENLYRALHRFNDRIPDEYNTSADARANYIASTVEVIPINLKERDRDGSHSTRTRFNIYVESPTFIHSKFNEWLDIFSKYYFRTKWGVITRSEPFLCFHCGSRAHPSGLCAYLTDVPGFQVRSITPNDGHHATPNTSHRGGFRGHGRGRGRGNHQRGRGYMRGRGY